MFPALPDRWHDAWFENLRAEGAFLVSSRLSDRSVAFIDITSEAKCLTWSVSTKSLLNQAGCVTDISQRTRRIVTHPFAFILQRVDERLNGGIA